jgi:hypothetical protein
MALAPADFYAYSRATGVPVPEDPEERAALAPEVLEFRRNQLRAPQEESNLPGILGTAALGLGALGAGAYGLTRLAGRGRQQEAPVFRAPQPTDLATVQKAVVPEPEQYETVKPSFEPPAAAIPQATVDLGVTKAAPGERMIRRHGRMVPASTVRRTPTAIPRATIDLTTMQEIETPAVVSQQNQANDTGLDQENYRNTTENKQRDIKESQFTAQDKTQYATPALQQLTDAGLPEFEINARIEAFANTGNRDFLNPGYNAATVEGGPRAFARALNIVNADVDRAGRIVSGDLVNPTGEIRRSFRGSQGTVMELKEGDYDPLAEMFGTEGGVEVVQTVDPSSKSLVSDPQEFLASQSAKFETRRIKQEKLSEQFQLAIDKFANQWDTLHREGPATGIYFPSREVRPIDAYDLDIPTRIEADEDGNLYPTARFREMLDEDTIRRVEAGEKVEVEVPFLVNKERAIADAEAFGKQMPELRVKAQQYIDTGRTLTDVYERTVGNLGQNKYVQQGLEEGLYFDAPKGENLTPETGRGSQKGRLVGGAPDVELPDEVYNLQYTPYTTKAGRQTKIVEGVTFAPGATEPTFTNVTVSDLDLNRLSDTGEDTGVPLYKIGRKPYDPEYITTQPMAVPGLLSKSKNVERAERNLRRQLNQGLIDSNTYEQELANLSTAINQPVGQIRKQGISKYGRPYDFLADVYEATDEIVQAPLQVEDLEGAPVSYAGRVRRSDMEDSMLRAQRQLNQELSAAKQETANLKKIGVPAENIQSINNFLNMAAGRGNLKTNPVAKVAREAGVPVPQANVRIAGRVQDELRSQKGIQLPVLESPTAYEFVQGIIGRPSNPPAQRRLVSLGKEGQIFPVAQEELIAAQQANLMPKNYRTVSQSDTSLTRRVSGPIPRDVMFSPKDLSGGPTAERVGAGAEDFIDIENYLEQGPSAYYGSVELKSARSPEEQRRATSPANKPLYTGGPIIGPTRDFVLLPETNLQQYPGGVSTLPRYGTTQQPSKPMTLRFGDLGQQLQALDPQGIGAEMQSTRQALAKVEPEKIVFSPERLPSNLEVVTNQLMAQAGRRAGKRRNR